MVVATGCALAAACGERFQSAAGQGGEGGGGEGGKSGVAGSEASGGEPEAGGADATSGRGGKGGATAGGGNGGAAPTAGNGGVSGIGGIGGLGGGGMPETLPISDDRLELWLRADNGVNVEGGSVESWADGSSFHRNAGQTAANYRPKLELDGLNGKPTIVFDGVDDSLDLPEMENDFSAGVSMFSVVRPSNQEACQSYFELSNGVEMDDLHLGDYRGSLLYEVASSYINELMYPLEFEQPIITASVHDGDGFARLRRNGNGVGELTDLPLPVSGVRKHNYLGLTLYVECVPMKGAISELVLFSRAVSDEELVEMEAHLREKWACCSAN